MSNQDTLPGYTSTGHRLSNAEHLDAHYVVCRRMYEAVLRAVGIQPGWYVLDAGCGSGSFLPLMAELVGASGKIDAFDLAPENIERVNVMVKGWDVPVTTQIGHLTELPYEDNTFDAIWNANVTQYLSDDEVAQMLKEFVRVVKPGGLVAIKEFDMTLTQWYPLDRYVLWRGQEQYVQTRPAGMRPASMRPPDLPAWLKGAGFIDVTQKTFLEEIRAPLSDDEHHYLSGLLQFMAKDAVNFALSESDVAQWRRCQDRNAPDNPVNQPDFYYREGATLVVGRKMINETL